MLSFRPKNKLAKMKRSQPLKQDISQSKLIISQSNDSVNARVSNIIVVKELLCVTIILTDVCGKIIFFNLFISISK